MNAKVVPITTDPGVVPPVAHVTLSAIVLIAAASAAGLVAEIEPMPMSDIAPVAIEMREECERCEKTKASRLLKVARQQYPNVTERAFGNGSSAITVPRKTPKGPAKANSRLACPAILLAPSREWNRTLR